MQLHNMVCCCVAELLGRGAPGDPHARDNAVSKGHPTSPLRKDEVKILWRFGLENDQWHTRVNSFFELQTLKRKSVEEDWHSALGLATSMSALRRHSKSLQFRP